MDIEYKSVKWMMYHGILVPDTPPHVEIGLSDGDIRYLLKKTRAYAVRWTSNFDCGFETGWWYVIKDKSSDEGSMSRHRRKKLKSSLSKCLVKRVDAACIAEKGYEVYKSAFERYETYMKPDSIEEFRKDVMAKADNPEYHFWAVFDRAKGDMIGFALACKINDCCIYSASKFKPDFLNHGSSYALHHMMNNYYLKECRVKYVNAGARNISHKTNIQQFLIDRFDFRKAYCTLNIAYRPGIGLLVRALYPFRSIVRKVGLGIARRLSILMMQEDIRRGMAKEK